MSLKKRPKMSTRTPAQRKAIAAAIARKNAAASSAAVTGAPPKRVYVKGTGGYQTRVSGYGDYKFSKKTKPSVGARIGAFVGDAAQKGIKALTGYGDYQVMQNTLLETNGPPHVINRNNKEFVVRHREYITDIYSSSGPANTPSVFGLQAFEINPGNNVTFPWLATIADKFEQYRIEGMVFEFKSLYSDAVVTQNGSIGSIVLATEYNSGSPSFTSKQAMENYQFAQSCKPSCSVLHPIECARSQNVLSELYIRTGAVPAGQDVKTYDFGDFQIASQGIPLGAAGAAVNLGELWCSYQIALIKPRIPTSSSTYTDSGFAAFSSLIGVSPWGTVAMPASGRVNRLASSNIDVFITADETFTLTLGSTPMKYQLNAVWKAFADTASALNVWRAPSLNFTNASSVNATTSGAYINELVPTGATALPGTGCSTTYFIQVPAATPSAKTAVLSWGSSFSADQVPAVRFDCYWNAVPTVLI